MFAHGATVCVDDQPFHDGAFDERLYRDELRAVFGDISRAEASVSGRHARYAALFHSQRTKDRCPDQRDFVRDLCGSFRLLHDLHLPVEFAFDESLDGLRETGPLLLLPGAAHLDSGDWQAVDGFMRRGGLVIAGLVGFGMSPECARPFGTSASRPAMRRDSPCPTCVTRDADRDILVRGRASIYRPGPAWSRGQLGEVVDPICETARASSGTTISRRLWREAALQPFSMSQSETAPWCSSPSPSSVTTPKSHCDRCGIS